MSVPAVPLPPPTAPPTPPAPPSTSRGRRTRSALLVAGRQVFEEVGLADARVDDIASRARVSHGTFYTWFDSKESLLRELVQEAAADMFSADDDRTDALDLHGRIERANRSFLRAWQRNSRLLRLLDFEAGRREEFRVLLLQLREAHVERAMEGVRLLQAAGTADPTLSPRVTAVALGGMVEHFAHVWIDLGEEVDEETAVRTLTVLWATALGVPPARSEPA